MDKLDITLINGIFECASRSEECERMCNICVDGRDIIDLYQFWEMFYEAYHDCYYQTFNKINLSQFEKLIMWEFTHPNDPLSVVNFDGAYEFIKNNAGQFKTIIDFGCSYGLQSFLFEGYEYIGVDDFYAPPIAPSYAKFFNCTAQDFIKKNLKQFDLDTTLALCFNLPDKQARDLIETSFPNNQIIWRLK